MFTVRLVPCGTNCFLIKKKPMWMIKKVSACLHLQGVSSPSSPQCERAAAVADLGSAAFVQSCSTPSGGNAEEVLKNQPDRRRQVLIERAWVLHRLVFVCGVFAVTCVCLCVMVVVEACTPVTLLSLSHHTTSYCVFPNVLKCITGSVALCVLLHIYVCSVHDL